MSIPLCMLVNTSHICRFLSVDIIASSSNSRVTWMMWHTIFFIMLQAAYPSDLPLFAVPPEIRMPTRRISQKQGMDTILDCVITAFPAAYNVWKKDGVPVPTNSDRFRVSVYEEGDHTFTLSLRIANIQPEDYGEYVCEAANALGRDEQSTFLDGEWICTHLNQSIYWAQPSLYGCHLCRNQAQPREASPQRPQQTTGHSNDSWNQISLTPRTQH